MATHPQDIRKGPIKIFFSGELARKTEEGDETHDAQSQGIQNATVCGKTTRIK